MCLLSSEHPFPRGYSQRAQVAWQQCIGLEQTLWQLWRRTEQLTVSLASACKRCSSCDDQEKMPGDNSNSFCSGNLSTFARRPLAGQRWQGHLRATLCRLSWGKRRWQRPCFSLVVPQAAQFQLWSVQDSINPAWQSPHGRRPVSNGHARHAGEFDAKLYLLV